MQKTIENQIFTEKTMANRYLAEAQLKTEI